MINMEHEIKRIRYPHMIKEEIEIWRRFLRKYGHTFENYEYDVHVGKGVGNIPGLSEPYRGMARTISQKRIDVVAYKGKGLHIIEIKEVANMEAIGQLEAYKTLLEDKKGYGTVRGLIIVALEIDQDIERAAKDRDIQIMLV